MKKKILNYVLMALPFILLIAVYVKYPIIVMPDSTEYYGYLKIFNGQEAFSNWNIVRGPSFPFILFVITKIFGNTQMGLVLGTLVFYLIVLILGLIVLNKIEYRNKVVKVCAFVLYYLLVVFNPMLIGYMHGLLTEFASMPMLMVFSFVAYKWIDKKNTVVQNVVCSLVLILGVVFMWFLKQPYVFLALAPLGVSALISMIENWNLKNIFFRCSIVLIAILSILIGIKVWNATLEANNVDMGTGRDTNSYLKPALINGNTAFSIDKKEGHYTTEFVETSTLISEKDKKEIEKILNDESKYKSFKLINVYSDFYSRQDDNISDILVLFSESEDYSLGDALKMYFKILFKYPVKTLKSYTLNYLALTDWVVSTCDFGAADYYPSLSGGYYFENKSIGYAPYYLDNNMLWVDEDHHLYANVENLKADVTANKDLTALINSTFPIYNFVFKVVMVLIPFAIVLLIRRYVKTKNKLFVLAIIMESSAFIHLLFHTVTGAIIDRYAIPVFPAAVVGMFVLIFESVKIKKEKEEKNKNENKENQNDENKEESKEETKVLIVVPAYNEELNIEKTIKDIKENSSYDYIIVNDCSKDNTKEICEKNGFEYLTLPINYGLTSGIQLGMKYAKKNGYNVVIQFDGDGQHQAKYLKNLVDEIENGSDIVIGSRFVTEKKPLSMRMLGSRVIGFIIQLTTMEKIQDPTSGMRAYNGKAIKEFCENASLTPEPDTIVYMLKKNMKVKEIQVEMKDREFGESYLSPLKSIKYMVNMIISILFIRSFE